MSKFSVTCWKRTTRLPRESASSWLAKHITAINLISSPGAGKTSLLEQTIPLLDGRYRIAVLEGDIATTRDSDRIEKLGVPVVQLLTGGACHLEAPLVQRGLDELNLDEIDLLFIENVGNIACPAEFDLGETREGRHPQRDRRPRQAGEISPAVPRDRRARAEQNGFDAVHQFQLRAVPLRFPPAQSRRGVLSGFVQDIRGIDEWVHWIEHVCAGELHFEPHTHSHDDLAGIIQPHQHPHRQHHEGVVRG